MVSGPNSGKVATILLFRLFDRSQSKNLLLRHRVNPSILRFGPFWFTELLSIGLGDYILKMWFTLTTPGWLTAEIFSIVVLHRAYPLLSMSDGNRFTATIQNKSLIVGENKRPLLHQRSTPFLAFRRRVEEIHAWKPQRDNNMRL